jgi:hypothetical protein
MMEVFWLSISMGSALHSEIWKVLPEPARRNSSLSARNTQLGVEAVPGED